MKRIANDSSRNIAQRITMFAQGIGCDKKINRKRLHFRPLFAQIHNANITTIGSQQSMLGDRSGVAIKLPDIARPLACWAIEKNILLTLRLLDKLVPNQVQSQSNEHYQQIPGIRLLMKRSLLRNRKFKLITRNANEKQ